MFSVKYSLWITAVSIILLTSLKHSRNMPAINKSVVDATVESGIAAYIAESEYHFKWSNEQKCWFTTNRNQGLRFIYSKNGFRAEPRVAEANAWYINFNLYGHPLHNGRWQVKDNTASYSEKNATLQYINTPQGMRQNFLLHSSTLLNAEGDLEIAVETNLHFTTDKTGVHFTDASGTGIFDYSDLHVWDAENKILQAYFKQTAGGFKIHIDTDNAKFPVTIDPIGTGTNGSIDWQSSGPNQAGAEFGVSIAGAGDVNGDGYSDVIAGAYLYDDGFADEGGAFIYYGSDTGLPDQPNLILSDGNQTFALFGINVDGAGDVNGDGFSDVIIGSWNYDDGIYNEEGRALVYYGSVSGISSQPDVVLNDCDQSGAFFGIVSGAGDVNGDGYSDVVVTAHNYDSEEQENTGRGFVYFGSAAGLSAEANAVLDDVTRKNTYLGFSVSKAGDINGDGYGDIIIGSPAFPGATEGEGIALVYHGTASGPENDPAIRITGKDSMSRFASSVAAAGDVNGDGYSDVIISSTPLTGSVSYIHFGSNAGIKKQAEVTLDDITPALGFADEAAGIGDVNGDGLSDVMIGALNYDEEPRNNIGKIYAYYGSPAGLSSASSQTVESNQSSSGFASGLQTAGDVNGDGYSDVIIGAANYDQGLSDAGAAFVYYGGATGIQNTPSWSAYGTQQAAAFGRSVTFAGDVNGDGYGDVAISSLLYDNSAGADAGRIYIYHSGATGLESSPAQILEGTQPSSAFGYGMAPAGDVNGDGFGDFVAGAWGSENGVLQNTGKILVYYGSDTGLSSTPGFVYQPTIAEASLGESVSAGDFNGDGYSDIVAGASFYTNAENKEGAVYIFKGGLAGISNENIQMIEGDQEDAAFGVSVSTAGDINGDAFSDLVIGARSYDGVITDQGAVFLYTGNATGVSVSPAAVLFGSQQQSFFGQAVSAAGDVNADGYSDIMIGAYWHDEGEENEGKAWIYHGSSNGLITTAAWTAQGNQAQAQFGQVVACAGDVNGDGFSDVMTGAPNFSNNQLLEGRALLYYGGNVTGRNNILSLYNLNTTDPISQGNINVPAFTAGISASGIAGRQKIKMAWEARAESEPFSKNLYAFTGSAQSWVDPGIGGTELVSNIDKAGFQTKLRARVEYQKTTALNGQVYGPWRYPVLYQQGILNMGTAPLPVNLVSFTAAYKGQQQVRLYWITENEEAVSQYIAQYSTNGIDFKNIADIASKNTVSRNVYEFMHTSAAQGNNFYRLVIKNLDGNITYSPVRTIRVEDIQCNIYPNPVKAGMPVNVITNIQAKRIILLNSGGVQQAVFEKQPITNNLQIIIPATLKAGMYFLSIELENGVVVRKKMFIEN